MTEQQTPGTDLELHRETQAVAHRDTDSWTTVAPTVIRLSEHIASTEFVPKGLRGKPPAVAAAILYGREVGLPPMTALTQTHVIEGRPSTSAEGMRALVIAQGHELVFSDLSGAKVTARARRRGSSTWTELTWTIDMARAAGLLTKDNWKNYPRAMLAARVTDELCGLVFPDVIHGLSVTDVVLDSLDEQPQEGEQTVTRAQSTTAPDRKPRKRTTSKRTTSKRTEPAPAPVEETAPPLPGEDGYDGAQESAAAAQSGEEPPVEGDTPAETPEPAEQPEEAQEGDVVDAEVVEEPPVEEPPVEEEAPPRPVTKPQLRMLNAALGSLAKRAEVTLEREERLRIVSALAGRELASSAHLSKEEASAVIDTLGRVPSLEAVYALLDGQGEQS